MYRDERLKGKIYIEKRRERRFMLSVWLPTNRWAMSALCMGIRWRRGSKGGKLCRLPLPKSDTGRKIYFHKTFTGYFAGPFVAPQCYQDSRGF